jgi:hypothetical protein
MADLMSPFLAGAAVHGDDRLHIGAGAREIDHVAAAEAVAKPSAPLGVADAASDRLLRHGLECRHDPPARFGGVLDQGLEKLHRVLGALRSLAFAKHVGDERHIAAAGERLGALDHVLGDAEPVGRDQKQRALRLDAVVVDKRAAAAEARRGILDGFDLHVASPLLINDLIIAA